MASTCVLGCGGDIKYERLCMAGCDIDDGAEGLCAFAGRGCIVEHG